VLHREPVTTDARLAAHLARLNGGPVEALHAVQCTAETPQGPGTAAGGAVVGPGRPPVPALPPPCR
jgi:hypothetical protein